MQSNINTNNYIIGTHSQKSWIISIHLIKGPIFKYQLLRF